MPSFADHFEVLSCFPNKLLVLQTFTCFVHYDAAELLTVRANTIIVTPTGMDTTLPTSLIYSKLGG